MKSTLLWSLAGLNLLLAAILIAKVMPEQSAVAQAGRPGDYLMIPGQATGLSYSVVYIVDQSNGTLGAMAWGGNKVETIPPIDLRRIFQEEAPRPRGR